jgi:hypothetical protein
VTTGGGGGGDEKNYDIFSFTRKTSFVDSEV